MAFKTPGKTLTRSKPLQSKGGMKRGPMRQGQGLSGQPKSPAEQRKAQQKALQAATLRALDKTRREAEAHGVALSDWESGFLEGLGERVKTYGRAFADPDKGAISGTLSLRQGVKLKEIRKKASKPASKPREG